MGGGRAQMMMRTSGGGFHCFPSFRLGSSQKVNATREEGGGGEAYSGRTNLHACGGERARSLGAGFDKSLYK